MPTVVSLLTRKLTLCKAAAEAVYIRGGSVVGPWWMKAAYFKGPKPSPAHQPENAAKSQPSWSCSYPAEEADGGLAAFLRGSVMCLGYSSHHEAQNKRWKAETGACRMANVVTWSCCSCRMGGVGRGFIKLLLRLFDRPEGTCSAALANVIRLCSSEAN